MKETPIIFNTENVKAILEGRKTQTRRVVTAKTSEIGEGGDWAKLCWDGSAIHTFPELGNYTPVKKQEKAPLPFVDDGYWERDHSSPMYLHVPYNWEDDMTVYRVYCRHDVGDRLWVRRTKDGKFIWKKSLAEIWLEITEIRVERLQEITEQDCLAEGITVMHGTWESMKWNNDTRRLELTGERHPYTGRYHFAVLWDSLNAKRGYSWESNPWVWVLTFKVI